MYVHTLSMLWRVVAEKAGFWRDIKFNPVPIEEYFHIIDEIGRFVLHIHRSVEIVLTFYIFINAFLTFLSNFY